MYSLLVVLVAASVTKVFFYRMKSNPHTLWAVGLHLSCLADATKGVNTPADIAAHGVIAKHKPPSHVTATVPVGGCFQEIVECLSVSCQ